MAVGGNNIEQIGENSPTGSSFGATSASKISFYGVTPVSQAAVLTAYTSGATTTAQAAMIVAMQTALTNLGICASA